MLVSAQQAPRQRPISQANRFPPEMLLDRFIDVAKVAPQYFTVEKENSEVRVLRAKLDGSARIPLHDDRSGVMVALSDVHLRLTTPDAKFRDVHLGTGETLWLDGDTFSEQNLSSSPVSFCTSRHTGPRVLFRPSSGVSYVGHGLACPRVSKTSCPSRAGQAKAYPTAFTNVNSL
jgi:hypothetical protein